MGFPWKEIVKVGIGVGTGALGGGLPGGIVGGSRAIFNILGGRGSEDAELFAEWVKFAQALDRNPDLTSDNKFPMLVARIRADRPEWKRRQIEYMAQTVVLEVNGDFDFDKDETDHSRKLDSRTSDGLG